MENTMVDQLQLAYDTHPDRAEYESRAALQGLELGTKFTNDWAKYFDNVKGKLVLTDKRCKYTVSNKLTSIMKLLALVKKSRVWQCKKTPKPRIYESPRVFPKYGAEMSTLAYVKKFYVDNFFDGLPLNLFEPMTEHISQFEGVDSCEVMA